MTDFPFNDRSSWLAWRADWRLRYAQATESVRAPKREMSKLVAERRTLATAKEREAIDERMSTLQSDLHYARVEAHGLMAERIEANERKAEQIAEGRRIAA